MAAKINPEFIERYQLEYQKNPRSRVFAPLAEAYRKMGLTDEALTIATAGVKFHPSFASGRVALAKILLDKNEIQAASEHLLAACKLSPDNLLAHLLLGETWLRLRKPKEALKAFKMVLFIDPRNEKAQAAVKKWEFLTADEYDQALFEHLQEEDSSEAALDSGRDREIERALSLADALTVRNEPERALEILQTASTRLNDPPELANRIARLRKRLNSDSPQTATETAQPLRPLTVQARAVAPPTERKKRREKLELFLRRIQERAVT